MSQAQEETSLLAKVVPVPTGRNGYEEYLRAGDLIGGPGGWGTYEQWIAFKTTHIKTSRAEIDTEEDTPALPPGISPEMSELEVRKVANTRLGGAYDILRGGNEKKVWDPRSEFAMTTTFPEFARFKQLAKLGANKAHVEFADGRTGQAVEDLLDGVRFSKNISGSIMISSLVGIAIQAIMLAELNEHLSQLCLSDAQMIDKASTLLIDERLPTADVFQRESEMVGKDLDTLIDQPDVVLSNDLVKEYGQTLKNLNSDDRKKLKDMLSQTLETRYSEAGARLGGPESDWLTSEGAEDPKPFSNDKSASNLALALANELVGKDMLRNYTKALCKGRVQLRLLRLHAKVLEYHWLNHVWPTKIEEFADASVAMDPFAREPFHYELKNGGYRLFSTGVPGAGPIELKYRPPASVAQPGGNDHP